MSCLTIIQYVAGRQGVPVPSTVIGTTDAQVLQMLRLLEEEGDDLAQRGIWSGLANEAGFSATAATNQGLITSMASNGFRFIKNNTFWDRTNKLPVLGPLSDQEWQAMEAVVVQGPRYYYRIRQGQLLINPTPPSGDQLYFEYQSKYWITDSTGTTYKQYFTADTDILLLPEEVVISGLRWRWQKEKGLPYADLFNEYEERVKNALSRDGGKPVLCMDNQGWRGPRPGIFIPDGNWSLP